MLALLLTTVLRLVSNAATELDVPPSELPTWGSSCWFSAKLKSFRRGLPRYCSDKPPETRALLSQQCSRVSLVSLCSRLPVR